MNSFPGIYSCSMSYEISILVFYLYRSSMISDLNLLAFVALSFR